MATSLHSIPGFILGAFVGGWIGKHQSVKLPVNFGAVVRLAVIGFFAFFLNPTMPIWVPIVVFFIGGFYTAMAGSLYTCLLYTSDYVEGAGIRCILVFDSAMKAWDRGTYEVDPSILETAAKNDISLVRMPRKLEPAKFAKRFYALRSSSGAFDEFRICLLYTSRCV